MKKLFTILLAVLVLGTCATTEMSAKKRKHSVQQASSGVNLYSENDAGNSGIFYYRLELTGGRQIHDYILGIDSYDEYCMPHCEAYYYDVYNDNIIYMQGHAKSKNILELESNDGFKLTVTYKSKNEIKVKEGTVTSTFKKIANDLAPTEEDVRNAVNKLP
ncbi:MAG: hypothetical protein IKX31_01575 [Muribaculaceae bacterium]|nr:hypothetical protein [Muribaculaceae bacterium]